MLATHLFFRDNAKINMTTRADKPQNWPNLGLDRPRYGVYYRIVPARGCWTLTGCKILSMIDGSLNAVNLLNLPTITYKHRIGRGHSINGCILCMVVHDCPASYES